MSVTRLFFRQIIQRQYEEWRKRKDKIHVSDLVAIQTCPRKVWFSKHSFKVDIDSLLKIWEGQQMHELPLLSNHEMEIELENVYGKVDEYDHISGILIDKKFVNYVPKDQKDCERYYAHYITQLKLYCYMLMRNNYQVSQAILWFKERNGQNVFEYIYEPNYEECEELFYSLKQQYEEEIRDMPDIPNGYHPLAYPCSYCEFRNDCYVLDAIGEKYAEAIQQAASP